MEFGHKLCGHENLLAVRKYDETYRRQRKLINRQLGTKSDAEPYHDMMEAEAGRFLVRSLEKPKGLMQHLRTATGATILRLTYGYCIQTNEEDPLVDLVERVTRNISDAFMPMAWLIDIIPAVQCLPDGFPGTAFKETARQWNSFSQEVADIPYSFVRNQMKIGSHRPSYISRILEERSSSAMVMFPDVQRKAQEEIDMVTECNSLPGFEDRDKLPYLEAVIKEVYRWSVVVPMGFPHVLEEDMVYNGYFIPKGAYLLPATWWFCHDPEVYTNPAVFNPDRFLKPRDEPDPRAVIFGFGRRKCPGRYITESSIFITIAQTLAAFRIKNAVDTQGFEIPVELDVTPSLISHPKDFLYDIVPKSPKHEQLIQAINTEHSYEKSDTSLLDKARTNKFTTQQGVGWTTGITAEVCGESSSERT
ncbi:O-methylsterigmatocystin oxidoreductase [Aspergillus piperis CBS 112811]|uniref:O-methylsterigmatocystin oxidoreductase n=1 Tax=Aspergillus piperis CBS 112811 TaxID=1448313 RepID=A0A8G1QY57_9EURO|nr:O-methylsterigmatocystin oxidoreductase [Aspergillus piperis CBS 112811]RAH55773.1 O-methylsterigmatocystin oxidoreductase [Aspergillus piperis CBS 112811]